MNDRELGKIEFDLHRGVSVEDAIAVREGMQNRENSALALYKMMRTSGQLPGKRLVEYRCRKQGCLVLDVFPTPAGPAVYLPAFRYSPTRNADTHPEARAKRTSDSERRWVESADLLDVDPPAGLGVEYWVNCDHLLDYPVPSERVNSDIATRPDRPVFLA